MPKSRLVSIYKSVRREGMYLYLDKGQSLHELPEGLMARFGRPVHAFDLLLTEHRKLARAEASKVLSEIEDRGFYLQMPPGEGVAATDGEKGR